jgi:predicted phage terminase large subunit-like protein
VIQTVDLGGKQGVGHDPSAIATWGYDGLSKYVLDYWSSQAEYADIKPVFAERYYEQQARTMFIEDATWAQPLISDLRRETGILVVAVRAKGSKWTRADEASPEFQASRVVLPCQAPWLDGWVHEHLSFPNGAHDEAVDTTSMAVHELREVGVQLPYGAYNRGKPLTRRMT